MHHKINKFLTTTLVILMVVQGGTQSYPAGVLTPQGPISGPSALVPTTPILITSEVGLAAAAVSNSWTGNGSITSPYVIANFSIVDLNNSATAIQIENTRSYIEIRNVEISEGAYGILFSNVSNVLVDNVTIVHSSLDGLRILNSDNVSVSAVEITNSTYSGVTVERSSGIELRGMNLTIGGASGVDVRMSTDVRISELTISNFTVNELYVASSTFISIWNLMTDAVQGNTLDMYNVTEFDIGDVRERSSSSTYAFRLLKSSNGTISGMSSFGAAYAGFIDEGSNITIRNSEFTNNSLSGIVIDRSNYTYVTSNTLTNSSKNSLFARSDNRYVTISNNTVLNTIDESGIVMDNSSDGTITENTVIGSGDYGIVTRGVSSLLVEDNTVRESSLSGLLVIRASDASYSGNTVYSNSGSGFDILMARNLTVKDNIVMNNAVHGLYVTDVVNATIRGNALSSAQVNGINLENAEGVEVFENSVDSNSIGVFLNAVNSTLLSKNNIFENGVGVQLLNTNTTVISNNNLVNNTGYSIHSGSVSTNSTALANNVIHNNQGGVQARSDGNMTFTGNFWSDLIAPDEDSDGVVDVVYNVTGDVKDFSPRTVPTADIDLYSEVVLIRPVLHFDTNAKYNESVLINWRPAFASRSSPITYDVEYSADNGTTWTAIAVDTTGTSVEWDTLGLENGSLYRIRVTARTAQLSKSVVSATFTVENVDKLSAAVLSADRTQAEIGELVTLTWQHVSDSLGHTVEYSLYYSVNGSSPVLIGRVIGLSTVWNTSALIPGTYTVKLVAEDRHGHSVVDTVTVELTVASTTPTTGRNGGDGDSGIQIGLLITGVVTATVAVLVLVKRKRRS